MSDQSKGANQMSPSIRADAMAEAILESSSAKDASLDQVREILFGAESRRVEAARVALEGRVVERFGRLEAEHERRFEKLLGELQQRFEKAATMLESEAAERRSSLQRQHAELMAQIESSAEALRQSKTNRDELAGLLEDLAGRLRAAGA
jgi:predicted transcriptional regulator